MCEDVGCVGFFPPFPTIQHFQIALFLYCQVKTTFLPSEALRVPGALLSLIQNPIRESSFANVGCPAGAQERYILTGIFRLWSNETLELCSKHSGGNIYHMGPADSYLGSQGKKDGDENGCVLSISLSPRERNPPLLSLQKH